MKTIVALFIAAGFSLATTQVQARDEHCRSNSHGRSHSSSYHSGGHSNHGHSHSSNHGSYHSGHNSHYSGHQYQGFQNNSCHQRQGVRIYLPGIGYVIVNR